MSSVKRRQQACAFGSTRSLLWSVSHSCTGGLCRHTCQLQVWAPGNGFSKVKSDTSGCPGASMDEADPWLCHVGTGCDVPLSPSPSLITAGDVRAVAISSFLETRTPSFLHREKRTPCTSLLFWKEASCFHLISRCRVGEKHLKDTPPATPPG